MRIKFCSRRRQSAHSLGGEDRADFRRRLLEMTGLGLLAALLLVAAGGCKKSSSAASPTQSLKANSPPATIAQVHWLGKTRIAAETNSALFLSLWNLPASAALERQTLDKLALALAGVSQATNIDVQPPIGNPWVASTNYRAMGTNYAALVASHPVAAQLRPLLANLVSQEWYLEIQQATNQPAEFALAVRLDPPQAALWSSNLSAVFGSLPNVQSLPSHLTLARAGDWTLVGLAQEHNTPLADFTARIHRGQTPMSAPETGAPLQMDPVTRKLRPAPASPAAAFWLEANLDLRRTASALALGWNLPAGLPKVYLSLTGDKQGVRTRADLDFPNPLPLDVEAWNIPTNLIHGPIIGFEAVRGIRLWLNSFKPWNELHLGTPPNQAFFWSQGGLPSLHFLAAPSAEASNQVNRLSDLVLRDLNPILATNGWPNSALARQTNSPGLAWRGGPYFSPNLDYAEPGGHPFLFAGLDRDRLTNPAPAGLFQYLEARPTLVAYDWEDTRRCNEDWTQIAQLLRHMLCLPRMTYSTGLAWLAAITPRLGNSETLVESTSPTRLSVVRSSTMGFTGVELQVLADWLESLQFPRGLRTFTAPTPPLPPPARSRTNSVPPPKPHKPK